MKRGVFMKSISAIIFLTVAIYSMHSQASGTGTSSNVYGQENKLNSFCQNKYTEWRTECSTDKVASNAAMWSDCQERRKKIEDQCDDSKYCQTAINDAKNAQKDLGIACSRSIGKGNSTSCVTKAVQCSNAEGTDDWSSSLDNIINTAASTFLGTSAYGMSRKNYTDTCPRRTLADWDKKKDASERDRSRLMDKMDRIQDDLSRIDEKKNDKAADLMESAQKAQEDYNKELQKIDKETAETEMGAKGKVREMTAKLASTSSQIRMAQATQASLYRARAAQLKIMSDALFRVDCKAQIEKALGEYLKSIGKVVTTYSNSANRTKSLNDLAKTQYATCLDKARAAKEQAQDEVNQKIIQQEEVVKNATQQMEMMKQEIADIQKSAEDAKTSAQQAKSSAYTAAQQKQQTAMQKLNMLSQSISKQTQQKQNSLNNAQYELYRTSNQFNDLGPEPKGDKLPSDAVDAAAAFVNTSSACQAACRANPQLCPRYNPAIEEKLKRVEEDDEGVE